MKTLLEWAQYYVHELGFSVIPLKFREKLPLVPWKHYQERRPCESELRRWFHRQDRNIGIVCGQVSGNLCVIDFDDAEIFERWNEGRSWKGIAVVTTGRGFHTYNQCFAKNLPSTGKAYFRGWHCGEIRFAGSYVVAPPSLHPSGWSYKFLSPLELTPMDFRGLDVQTRKPVQKARKPEKPKRRSVSTGLPANIRDPWRYCQAALEREERKILRSAKGERNDKLFRAGLKLKKYLDVLDEEVVRKHLFNAGCQVGLPEEEVLRTITSAWRY